MRRWVAYSPFALLTAVLLAGPLLPDSASAVDLLPGLWTRPSNNAVMEGGGPGGFADVDQVFGATVLARKGNFGGIGPFNYQMWYSGRVGGQNTINYAQSQDGITWQKYINLGGDCPTCENPVMDNTGRNGLFDSRSQYNPGMLDEITGPCKCFRMLYEGSGNGPSRVGLATSSNGVSFSPDDSSQIRTEDPVVPTTSGRFYSSSTGSPTWFKDGNIYKMWFTGVNDDGLGQIGYGESTDGGLTWSIRADPVLKPDNNYRDSAFAGEPSVLKDSMYRMWYTGVDGFGTVRILYATSTDGISWNKYRAFDAEHSKGIYDEKGVSAPTVVNENGDYRMWFTSKDPNDSLRIAYSVNPKPTVNTPNAGSTSVTGRGTPQTQVIVFNADTGEEYGRGNVNDDGTYSVNTTAIPSGVTVAALVDGRDTRGIITTVPAKQYRTANVLLRFPTSASFFAKPAAP